MRRQDGGGDKFFGRKSTPVFRSYNFCLGRMAWLGCKHNKQIINGEVCSTCGRGGNGDGNKFKMVYLKNPLSKQLIARPDLPPSNWKGDILSPKRVTKNDYDQPHQPAREKKQGGEKRGGGTKRDAG